MLPHPRARRPVDSVRRIDRHRRTRLGDYMDLAVRPPQLVLQYSIPRSMSRQLAHAIVTEKGIIQPVSEQMIRQVLEGR